VELISAEQMKRRPVCQEAKGVDQVLSISRWRGGPIQPAAPEFNSWPFIHFTSSSTLQGFCNTKLQLISCHEELALLTVTLLPRPTDTPAADTPALAHVHTHASAVCQSYWATSLAQPLHCGTPLPPEPHPIDLLCRIAGMGDQTVRCRVFSLEFSLIGALLESSACLALCINAL